MYYYNCGSTKVVKAIYLNQLYFWLYSTDFAVRAQAHVERTCQHRKQVILQSTIGAIADSTKVSKCYLANLVVLCIQPPLIRLLLRYGV